MSTVAPLWNVCILEWNQKAAALNTPAIVELTSFPWLDFEKFAVSLTPDKLFKSLGDVRFVVRTFRLFSIVQKFLLF